MSMGEMNKLKINDTITNISIKNISNRSAKVGTWSIKNVLFLKLDTFEHLGCYNIVYYYIIIIVYLKQLSTDENLC